MIKVTVGVKGMMCGKCESHMNDAIRESFKVKSVESSHTDERTVILSKEDISEEKMRQTVAGAGYTMTSFAKQPCEKKGLFSFGKK